MRRKIIVMMIGVLLLLLAWGGTAYAQEDPGYPIDTETPTETEVPTKPPEETPTPPPDPTEPSPDPTDDPQETPVPPWIPTVEPPAPSETPDDDFEICPFPRFHPMLTIIADRYQTRYETVVDMFCSSHMGIGEIVRYLESLPRGEDGTGAGCIHYPLWANPPGWGWYSRVFNPVRFPAIYCWSIRS